MKFIVLLLVIVSVGMFAWALTAPGRLLPSANFWQDDESQQTSEKADAKLTASLDAKSASIADFSTRRKTPTARGTSPDTTATAEILPARKARVRTHSVRTHPVNSDVFSRILTVSGDSASLYAKNFSKSNVLTVLRKGTIVEADLQLLDATDDWTLVRVPALKIGGFIQTRNLATPSQETTLR